MQRRHPDIRRDLIVLQITGHLFFLGLALISVVFWKERQAFDAGHYLYELIDRKFFFIAHQRPIGFVSQVLPVIGIWLKLPLSFVAILFSLGDILWYYLIFLLLAYGFESRKGIVSLLLILSLTVRYSFFCPVTELLQAGALLPVWMGLLDRTFRFRYVVLILLAAVIIFSHPLLFYPLFFTLFWWSFQKSRPGLYPGNGRKYFITMLTMALVAITVLKILLLDKYDHDKTFYAIEYNDYGYLTTFRFPVFLHHAAVLAKGAPVLAIIFLTAMGSLLWFRRWWQAGYLLAAISGFLLIMSLTHRFEELSNYFERMLLPVPMMMAIVSASVITVTRTFIARLGAFVGLVLILLMHFDVLRISAQPFSARVDFITELCQAAQSLNIRKAIASDDLLEQNSYAMTGWSFPIETLLISSYESRENSVTIALEKDQIERNKKRGMVAGAQEWIKWGELIQNQSTLNESYFRLPDGEYQPLLSSDTSYTGTVRLQLRQVRLQKPNVFIFDIGIHLSGNGILPNNGNTVLKLKSTSFPELRTSVIPYRFRNNGFWSFSIPVSEIPDEPLLLELFAGSRKLGELPLRKSGQNITAE